MTILFIQITHIDIVRFNFLFSLYANVVTHIEFFVNSVPACLDILKHARHKSANCSSIGEKVYSHKSMVHILDVMMYDSDVIITHGDMFLNMSHPRFLPSKHPENAWTPYNTVHFTKKEIGGRPVCRQLGTDLDGDKAWYWWNNDKVKCSRMMQSSNVSFPECCYGWVDFVYIPRHAIRPFVTWMQHGFWNLTIETSIPTVLNLLEGENILTWLNQPCLGSCCRTVSWKQAYKSPCAHRVDLKTIYTKNGTRYGIHTKTNVSNRDS